LPKNQFYKINKAIAQDINNIQVVEEDGSITKLTKVEDHVRVVAK
jgi:hypothetical protein